LNICKNLANFIRIKIVKINFVLNFCLFSVHLGIILEKFIPIL
jgi:hypothetical protein